MMDVFSVGAERLDPTGIGFSARGDFIEGGERLLHFGSGENADRLERLGPRAVHGDLVRQQSPVEREGALERVEALVRLAFEASAPQLTVFAFGHPRRNSSLHSERRTYELEPSAFAFGRTVIGSAKRLMKPSASFGL